MKYPLFLATLLCCFNLGCFGQTTYYFKLTSYVEDGVKYNVSTSSGIFVTLNKNICYDSDVEGMYIDNGKLSFYADNGKVKMYKGYCSFGDAKYCFSFDMVNLNVITSDDICYIYIKSIPDNKVVTSSYHGIKYRYDVSENSAISSYPHSQTSIVESVSESTSQSSSSRYGYRSCSSCYGSGKCVTCNGKGYTINSYTGNYIICTVCNKTGRCRTCKGTGQTYGVK